MVELQSRALEVVGSRSYMRVPPPPSIVKIQ